MAAIDNTQISNILNALTPTGAAGIPGAFTAFAASAMKLRLNSGTSTASRGGHGDRQRHRVHGGRVDVLGAVHRVVGGYGGRGAVHHPVARPPRPRGRSSRST